jgi:hypothetical protein
MRPTEQGVAIHWYEEESIYDEETVEDDTMIEDDALFESTDEEEEEEYTEVTYESEEVTQEKDDILLGVLPPAPPLLDGSVYSYKTDKSSELRLLEAMCKKRVDNTTLQKGEQLDDAVQVRQATQASSSKKNQKNNLPPTQRPKPLHHHSPTGVWDFPMAQLEPQEEETQARKEPVRVVRTRTTKRTLTSPRVAALDRIFLQQEKRRAFTVPSADTQYQKSSLQKFWKEMILYEMETLERQLASLTKEMNSVEKQAQKQRQSKSSP